MKKILKASKGTIFIIIGLLFLFVTFYNVSNTIDYYRNGSLYMKDLDLITASRYYLSDYLTKFISPTIFNYLFSVLFIAIGSLELIESGIFKKEGVDSGN